MEKIEQIFTTIKDYVMHNLSEPDFYMQVFLIIVACGLGKLCSLYTKKYIRKLSRDNTSQRSLVHGLTVILTPGFTAIFASFFLLISRDLVKMETDILSVFTKLTAIWTIIRFISDISPNKAQTRFFGAIILPVVILAVTGLLEPLVKYLEEINYKVGKFNLSVYTVINALIWLMVLIFFTRLLLQESSKYIRRAAPFAANTNELIIKILEILIYFIALVIFLNILGINLTALAVFSGAIGVGIGLGLQKIASNFMGGLILLTGKSVRIGDQIALEGSSVSGTVRNMGARNIIIENADGREIMVPNEDFITSKVTNFTYSNRRSRAEIRVNISYQSDVKKAREIILKITDDHNEIEKHPEAPSCLVSDFSDIAAVLVLNFWVSDINTKGRIRSEVMLSILDKFKENAIEIPTKDIK